MITTTVEQEDRLTRALRSRGAYQVGFRLERMGDGVLVRIVGQETLYISRDGLAYVADVDLTAAERYLYDTHLRWRLRNHRRPPTL